MLMFLIMILGAISALGNAYFGFNGTSCAFTNGLGWLICFGYFLGQAVKYYEKIREKDV